VRVESSRDDSPLPCLQCGLIGNGLPISPLKPLHLLYARESAGIPVCAGSLLAVGNPVIVVMFDDTGMVFHAKICVEHCAVDHRSCAVPPVPLQTFWSTHLPSFPLLLPALVWALMPELCLVAKAETSNLVSSFQTNNPQTMFAIYSSERNCDFQCTWFCQYGDFPIKTCELSQTLMEKPCHEPCRVIDISFTASIISVSL